MPGTAVGGLSKRITVRSPSGLVHCGLLWRDQTELGRFAVLVDCELKSPRSGREVGHRHDDFGATPLDDLRFDVGNGHVTAL
jgi:hypothetical protein